MALEARRVIIKSEDEKINNDKRRMDERLIIPYYVLEEWRKINEIEIQLYPRQEDIDKTILYDARESINIGKAFVNLSHSFSHTVFLSLNGYKGLTYKGQANVPII